MSGLQLFMRDDFKVRAVQVEGEAHFVGRDVATALGYSNPSKAMGDHCKGVTKQYPLETPGGLQMVRVLAEADVLRLIISSKLPAAEKFERWVFEDVLPTIRKTGGYQMKVPQSLPEALRLAADLADQKAKAEAELAIAAPKAAALDLISASDEDVTISQAAKILGIRRDRLTNWMHTERWIFRQNESWVAYQPHINNGRLRYKEAKFTDESTGLPCVKPYCHVTPKGLAKLAQVFQREVAAA